MAISCIHSERQQATSERPARVLASHITGFVWQAFLCSAWLMLVALMGANMASAQSVEALPNTNAPVPFLLGPPKGEGPVAVEASFELHDINLINDEDQVFEFCVTIVLKWLDPRQAFDPAKEGVDEKVFQGTYQFDEISPGWFPQLVLVNAAEPLALSGVVLRILPDGTSILTSMMNAASKVDLDLTRFPFDRHEVEILFEVLGFDASEVLLKVAEGHETIATEHIRVPQWWVQGAALSTRERQAFSAGPGGVASTLVFDVKVDRQSWYVRRLIVLPLFVIVMLSFSVFWMDRSSLGDRISVSFIGILTAVAYQTVMSDNLPRIAYVTLMHAFLNISFITMCATVIINLWVGALDKKGKHAEGDRLDRRCRWIFPCLYYSSLLITTLLVFAISK